MSRFVKAIFGVDSGATQLSERPNLNDSLHEFYRPANGVTPNVEIIFFHGLQRGDYKKAFVETWTTCNGSTSLCWPKDWLAEKFPKARILSVSYDSSTMQRQKHGRMDLYCIVENVIQDLIDHDRGGNVAATDGCPLILVGKDVGGLIIKAICMRAHHDRDRIIRYRSFLSNIKGVLYYSTPHLGFRSWPATFDGGLAKNLGLLNADIVRLNEDFARLRAENRWKAKQLIAGCPSSEPLFDVPEATARVDVDLVYTADEDIYTICKPREKKSICFTYLTGLISQFVTSGSESTGPQQREPELTSTEVEHATGNIIKWKSSLPFVNDVSYVPLRKTIDKVRTALESANIVVLHGGPGHGKSSLARYLALQFQEESRTQLLEFASTSNRVSCFSDGVFYLTCGMGANPISKQRELLRRCGVDVMFQDGTMPEGEEFCTYLHEKLVEHLQGRRALVIVDDVWGSDHDLLQKLLVPGIGVKYLITTQVSTLWMASDSEPIRIEDVDQEDGRKILANYAKFDGGVMPSELENVVNDIINATDCHPLALATLGLVMGRRDKTSIHEWQGLKNNLLKYLTTQHHSTISFGARYPLPVHASMMFAVDLLNDDAKRLLDTIVIFKGPSIPDILVQLFLMYTQPQGYLTDIDISRLDLETRGLVQVERKRVFLYAKYHAEDWRALSIHGLRQQFVLTMKKEDILEITRFLDGDSGVLSKIKRFIRIFMGGPSSFDLATALCVLYGVTDIQQRAMDKLGSHFIWSKFDRFNLVAGTLRIMVSFMFVEGQQTPSKVQIAQAATKVFWKLFTKGKLDDHSISSLLDLQECTISTSTFIRDLRITFQGTCHELFVKAFPRAISSLVKLLSKEMGGRCEGAARTIQNLACPSINRAPISRFPSCLERLIGLLGQDVDKSIQENAVDALGNLAASREHQIQIDILATSGLLESLVRLLCKEMEGRCKGAARTIRNLASASPNKAPIARFPLCLDRLFALLAQDVDTSIQEHAMNALGHLAASEEDQIRIDILAIPSLLESLVRLLSKEMEGRCEEATRTIQNLACPSINRAPISRFPLCLDRLVALLAQDVDKSIQGNAVEALGNLAASHEHQIRIDILATSGLLESLVRLLCQEMEGRCEGAARTIRNLASASPNRAPIARFPLCLDRLFALLAQDVDTSIQEHAMNALGHLAASEEDQIRIDILATPGLLESLVRLLSKEMEGRCEEATRTIQNLACPSINRAPISRFPLCLDRLVALLAQDVDKSIQGNAVEALGNLAASHEHQIRIDILATSGLLESLVRLLCKEMEGRCEGATRTIQNLACPSINKALIVRFPSCIDRLVGLLAQDVDKSIQEHGVWALGNLLVPSSIGACALISALPPGMLDKLIILLSDSNRKLCEGAAVTIHKLAVLPENAVCIAHHPGVINVLATLLSEKAHVDESIRRKVAGVIANLVSASENRLDIVGAIEGLVKNAHVTETSSSEFYRSWSYVKAKLNDYEGALDDMNKALALDPDYGFLWQERGVLLRLMGDLPGALADLDKGLAIGADDYERLKHRGLVKYMTEDKDGARADAERAIEVRPPYVDDEFYGRDCCFGVLPVEFLNYTLK